MLMSLAQDASCYLRAKPKVMEPGALLHGYLVFMPGFLSHRIFSVDILHFEVVR